VEEEGSLSSLQVKISRASSPTSSVFCRSRVLEGIHTELKIVLQVKISRASSPTSSVFCRSRVLEGIHAELKIVLQVKGARGHPRRGHRPCSAGQGGSSASSPTSSVFCRSRGLEGIHAEATDLVLQVKGAPGHPRRDHRPCSAGQDWLTGLKPARRCKPS
jgi:hypothetical protein